MERLFDIEGPWRPLSYSPMDHKLVLEHCREICRRTGYRAYFNDYTQNIAFGFHRDGEFVQAWSIPWSREGGAPIRFEQDELYDVEQVVYVLQIGKRSREAKKRLIERCHQENAEKRRERRAASARVAGDVARDRFRVSKRTSAVMSGRKGN